MKRIMMAFLAIFFPWLLFFLKDNPVAGIIALVMQATLVGWIPASMWAWQTIHPASEKKKPAKPKENKNISNT